MHTPRLQGAVHAQRLDGEDEREDAEQGEHHLLGLLKAVGLGLVPVEIALPDASLSATAGVQPRCLALAACQPTASGRERKRTRRWQTVDKPAIAVSDTVACSGQRRRHLEQDVEEAKAQPERAVAGERRGRKCVVLRGSAVLRRVALRGLATQLCASRQYVSAAASCRAAGWREVPCTSPTSQPGAAPARRTPCLTL